MSQKLTILARTLRKNSTRAERILWRYLRSKQLAELKFRRQEPIGSYIVDFVCFSKKIIIELDGGQHGEEKGLTADFVRSNWLEKQGFKILRFWNNDVINNLEVVWEKIKEFV